MRGRRAMPSHFSDNLLASCRDCSARPSILRFRARACLGDPDGLARTNFGGRAAEAGTVPADARGDRARASPRADIDSRAPATAPTPGDLAPGEACRDRDAPSAQAIAQGGDAASDARRGAETFAARDSRGDARACGNTQGGRHARAGRTCEDAPGENRPRLPASAAARWRRAPYAEARAVPFARSVAAAISGARTFSGARGADHRRKIGRRRRAGVRAPARDREARDLRSV